MDAWNLLAWIVTVAVGVPLVLLSVLMVKGLLKAIFTPSPRTSVPPVTGPNDRGSFRARG